ncbi:hypothetical protein BDN72DRAFT_891754 [Pluteus cervinus]|uniref:Uncharacterized protein n=1 Tax=Pluteus cervinus TaxID=181527 RepID=A0ACD3BD67_9AGAR|nr:hypothetical protein BDN72DRAFT_891754 [Pluteus cervinus]
MYNPPSPNDLPPPAYSEQEFDQKTSLALQESTSTPQPTHNEEWQEWDESEYQKAAAALRENDGWTGSSYPYGASASSQSASSSSSAQHRPLPSNPTSPTSTSFSVPPTNKPRPSWYKEAGLGAAPNPIASSSPMQGVDEPSQSRPTSSSQALTQQPPMHHTIPDDDDDMSVPPPPFAVVDPGEVVMTYPSTQSNSPSPLTSPTLAAATPLPHRVPSPAYAVEAPRHQSQYIQPSPYQGQAYASQPTTPSQPAHFSPYQGQAYASQPTTPMQPTHFSLQQQQQPQPQTRPPMHLQPTYITPVRTSQPPAPQMSFNPSVAYSSQSTYRGPISSNATAFYNSAVSAQLGAAPSHPARTFVHHAPKPPPPPPLVGPYSGAYVGQMQYQNYTAPPQRMEAAQNVPFQYQQYAQQPSWPAASSPPPMRPQSIIAPSPQTYQTAQFSSQQDLDHFRAELARLEQRNASVAENTNNIQFF